MLKIPWETVGRRGTCHSQDVALLKKLCFLCLYVHTLKPAHNNPSELINFLIWYVQVPPQCLRPVHTKYVTHKGLFAPSVSRQGSFTNAAVCVGESWRRVWRQDCRQFKHQTLVAMWTQTQRYAILKANEKGKICHTPPVIGWENWVTLGLSLHWGALAGVTRSRSHTRRHCVHGYNVGKQQQKTLELHAPQTYIDSKLTLCK